MVNGVALFVVLSSLVTASVWSPIPENQPKPTEDVIVKNGHQKVVEFDKEDGNTKVSISPQEAHKPRLVLDDKCYIPTPSKGEAEDAKEVVKEAVIKCRDKAKEVEERAKEAVSEVFRTSKERVERETSEISGKVHEVKDEAEDAIREAPGKAKETVFEKAQEVKEAVRDETQKAKETVSEKAQEVKEAVGDATQKAKETVWHATQKASETVTGKAQNIEEGAKKMAGKAKEVVHTFLDTSKTMGKDVKRNVATTLESGKETVKEKAQQGDEAEEHFAEQVTGTAKRVKEQGEKDLDEILRRGREVGYDMLVYVVSPRAVEPAVGVAHLLGFAAAYGMCLWVTFVSSYILSGALPRQQFGVVQSKLYPIYFRTMAYSVALVLLGHLFSHRKRMLSNHMAIEVFLGFNLLAALLMILFNLLYLEPRATQVMFEGMEVEKEEGRGIESSISERSSKAAADPIADSAATAGATVPAVDATSAPPIMPEKLEQVAVRSHIVELSERLRKLNAYSSYLNVLTLMLLTWHLVYLGQHLHVAC